MNSIVLTDTDKFQELIDRYNATLNQINDISNNITKEFNKLGYGDMWDGIAKERAMEKEKYLRSNSNDVQTVLRHKLKVMSSALNSYLALDRMIDSKISGSN